MSLRSPTRKKHRAAGWLLAAASVLLTYALTEVAVTYLYTRGMIEPTRHYFSERTDPKGNVRRAIGTGAGIIFKGSGFYETDYRSKNYRDGESKAKSAASSSTASSGSKAKKSAKKTPAEASK